VLVVAIVFTGCQTGIPDLFVPQYNPMMQRSTAVLTGRLVVEEGCIWIQTDTQRWLALWPTTIRIRTGEPLTVVGNCVEVAAGEQITVGGGGYEPANVGFVEGLIRESIHKRCRGNAWLVTQLLPGPIP
jgi:hypothetical protein